jgi:hypothetical protein
MMKKLLFCFPTIGLMIGLAASSYHITIFEQSTAAGKTLAPGDYKLEVKDDGITLTHKKQVTEIPAHVQDGSYKFNQTTVKFNNAHEIQEIHLGGTTKTVIVGAVSAEGASQRPVKSLH